MKLIYCCAIATLITAMSGLVMGSIGQAIANDSVPLLPEEPLPAPGGEPTPIASCIGESCVNQNPIEHGCDAQTVIEAERTLTVHRWQDSWQPRQIVIQKLYSEPCNANWTRAFVPNNTYLFIRENQLPPTHESLKGLVRAVGTEYFWFDSKMAVGAAESQACAALVVSWWWLERYCTELN